MFEMTKDISVRVKTGVVLIIGMLILGYIDSYFLFWLVFGIMLMISVHESKELYKLNSDSIYIYTLLLWIAVYFYPMPIDLIFIVAIGYASQLAYKRTLDKKLFLPLLYPTASFIFLMTLYSEYGVKVLLWLFVIVAATDIGAYFVGRSFGKTKFCETSPNKTLEGVFGGMAFAIILGTLTSISEVGIIGAIIVSAIVSLSSVFGDLYESYLKREAGVKDSGTILPGHGGVLDRVDGYLFGAITMVVLLRVII
ncbi:phosphatidate cytidylyltransferase [Aliarcobacter butzleri]|uniref:Phosphatidate cytidylyltransferase n=1 Tax=Aliarcobacter butzleri (strain RM4018) TaxID=367737 RepID=A8ER70_ALIB4|nr:phosphatidate cytidylyltransferase [Aliarcobacter butzleri]ABV66444.1 CDP-diglyceride synthetase CdsA [Aliarcobacter butzleri RM4018]MDS1314670.1 phosphatidate cytidylyltransferase [Aliarcobacter butzleri]GGT75979.1 phosphatidate cytidylyltransferase [Aliarcobacter butzleri]SNV23362.1 Phosphatidate cytidylyltransferase [Aliarcobacter butzleri]